MRCNQCNKFVSFEEGDPEVNDLEINDGTVSVSVRIVNNCSGCGQEMTEANLEMTSEVTIPDEHKGEGHEITVEEEGCERTSRSGNYGKGGKFTPSSGRYAKTFYGASLTAKVSCSCGEWEESVTMEDEVQASGMDEIQ